MLQGYECTIAEDGLDALGKIDSAHFDLVITDIDMPRMDGFGLIQGIRSRPNLHGTPILVVSYKDRVVDREKSISLGAQAYLSKGSFKDDSFVQTVGNLLLQPKGNV
jgi:CheY-like chemotaxis protein